MIDAERRPKIVHLTSVHTPSDTRIVHKECVTLAQDGYDVVLIAPGPQRALPSNVRHHPVAAPRNRFERLTRTILRVYRAAREERGDLYHFHDPELMVPGIALRIGGARVIFDVHEDVPLDIKTKPWIPRWLRPAVSGLASIALRAAQPCFSAIVSATPSIARTFTHRRTVIVRNYPLHDELAGERETVPFGQRPMTVLYLGSITALRGATEMVRAMDYLTQPPDARLLMAGEFEDEALRAHVMAQPGWAHVDAPGLLPRGALASVLANARVGLLLFQPAPNHDNAMPTKLFEYMGAGLPVVVSKLLAECAEIVGKHRCGILVDPRDSREIAQAIGYLLLRPDEAQAMGERGRKAIDGRYEWASEARTLLDLYRTVAS